MTKDKKVRKKVKARTYKSQRKTNNDLGEVIIRENSETDCDNNSNHSVAIITKPAQVFLINDTSSSENSCVNSDNEFDVSATLCLNCTNINAKLNELIKNLNSVRSELGACALETISIELDKIAKSTIENSTQIETTMASTATMLIPPTVAVQNTKHLVKATRKILIKSKKLPKFPIDDPKIFIELENKSQADRKFANNLKNKFMKYKLNDSFFYEYAQLVLRRLLTDKCIKPFSWTGLQSTIPIRDYTIMLILRECIHKLYPNATNDRITTVIRNYITNAKGRIRRQMKSKKKIYIK